MSSPYACGYVFLAWSGKLTRDQRLYVVREAFEMYLTKEKRRPLTDAALEGVLRTDGSRQCLVTFVGQKFEAELETDAGKVKAAFLVMDPSKKEIADLVERN